MESKSKTKNSTAVIIILVLIVIGLCTTPIMIMLSNSTGHIFIKVKQKALVVKVNEYDLGVVLLNDDNSFKDHASPTNVSFGKKGNIGFKPGQEILIYYGGLINQMYPAIIGASKIEIIKEKSDIPIPENVLCFYYNSPDKVVIEINEITRTNMTITIKDTNETKYNISNNYQIHKNHQLMNRNTNTLNKKICEQYFDDINQTLTIKYNWEELYGELEERKL